MMISRQQKIAAIYDKIADKTLSFGCRFKMGKLNFTKTIIRGGGQIFWLKGLAIEGMFRQPFLGSVEIIGHPVMIGDVLDWIFQNKLNLNCGSCGGNNTQKVPYEETIECDNCGEGVSLAVDSLIYLYNEKRKPIEDQSDECIDFIFSLLEQGNQ